MRKLIIVAAAIACAVLGRGTAEAANCATVSFSPTSLSFIDWDPITPADKISSFTATITPIPSATKAVRIIFIDNDSGTTTKIASAGPQYRITNGGNDYAFQSGTTLTTSFPQLTASGTISPSFTVTVPANPGSTDYAGGTTFTESLRYSIKCYNNGGSEVGTPGDLLQSGPTISLTVPKLVSIVAGTPTTINFGNFSTTNQTIQVGLKSTSTINVSVGTSNVNQMVLVGAVTPYPANSVIPYTMTLNGVSIAHGTSLTNQARAGVAGTSWPLILTLQNNQLPSGKLAGGYSDTITLTLTPGT